MSTQYDLTIADFSVGDRVESHPATNAWMAGDRYGTVAKIGRKYVYANMDKSDKTLQFIPENLQFTSGNVEQRHASVAEIAAAINAGSAVAQFSFGTVPITPTEMVVRKRPAKAHYFRTEAGTVSTRSSDPVKRKLAKKLLEKAVKNG